MNKVKFFIVLAFAIGTSLQAQNNVGIDYFVVKDYELSKKFFLQELATNPAEANYYLGEIAFAEGRLDDAENYFNQSIQTTTMEPFCRAGLAKISLKKGQKIEGITALQVLQKRYPKNIDVLSAIGYAYLDNQMKEEVRLLIRDMQKANKYSPKIYVLEGDLLKSEQDFGNAAGKYDMAILFDAKYAPAYIKGAELLEKGDGWQTAVEKLQAVTELYPNYTLPHRYLGRIYTEKGQYTLAIESFKIYFAGGYYSLDDIAKYASALYFKEHYEESTKMIKEGLAIAPDHFVLNRLQVYIAASTLEIEADEELEDDAKAELKAKRVEAGLGYADYFFSLQKTQKNVKYISQDYEKYAVLLKEAQRYDEAIVQYKQAISMDTTVVELYKEMATIASQNKQSGIAADYYNSYILKTNEEKIEAFDYFQLGRYYYSAVTLRSAEDTAAMLGRLQDADFMTAISANEIPKDSLFEQLFMKSAVKYYLNQADKAFDKVIELVPDGYTGYLWKARVNSLLDPDSEMGLAKPHYEKTVEILSTKEEITGSIRVSLIESYTYLGYFYYLKDDKSNATSHLNKVLELDPQNATATMLLKLLK